MVVRAANHIASNKNLKSFLLIIYFKYVDRKFKSYFSSTDLIVNSNQLFQKYSKIAKSISIIKTTTLRDSDYYRKENLFQTPKLIFYILEDWKKTKG